MFEDGCDPVKGFVRIAWTRHIRNKKERVSEIGTIAERCEGVLEKRCQRF